MIKICTCFKNHKSLSKHVWLQFGAQTDGKQYYKNLFLKVCLLKTAILNQSLKMFHFSITILYIGLYSPCEKVKEREIYYFRGRTKQQYNYFNNMFLIKEDSFLIGQIFFWCRYVPYDINTYKKFLKINESQL